MCGASACTKPLTECMIVWRPGVDPIGTEDRPRAVRRRRLSTKLPLKLVPGAQPVGRDLMAHRARNAVGRQPVHRRSLARRQRLAGARTPRLGRRRPVRCAESSACGTRRTRPECRRRVSGDRSSRAAPRLPVRIAGRIGHHRRPPGRPDRHVLAGRRREVVVAGHAVLGVREERQVPVRVAAAFRSSPPWRRLRAGAPRGRRTSHEQAGDREQRAATSAFHHFQNWNRPPSNQSHSR